MIENNELDKSQFYDGIDNSKNQPLFNVQSQSTINVEKTYTTGETLNNILSNLENINIHYLCPKCLNFPFIEFIDEIEIKYNCGCSDRKEHKLKIKDLFDPKLNYMIYNNIKNNDNAGETFFNNEENKDNDDDNINRDIDFKCKKHKSFKTHKFRYYCTNCHKNLCKECCQRHYKSHNLIVFDLNNSKIIEKLIGINDIINNKKRI